MFGIFGAGEPDKIGSELYKSTFVGLRFDYKPRHGIRYVR